MPRITKKFHHRRRIGVQGEMNVLGQTSIFVDFIIIESNKAELLSNSSFPSNQIKWSNNVSSRSIEEELTDYRWPWRFSILSLAENENSIDVRFMLPQWRYLSNIFGLFTNETRHVHSAYNLVRRFRNEPFWSETSEKKKRYDESSWSKTR